MRPTTAKVLESLVATLGPYWEGARVLDLFAGSGSLGGAALEAGCAEVVFVEGHPRVARQLSQRWAGAGQVVTATLPQGLSRLQGCFDIVLADPPYGDPAGPATLDQLGRSALVGPATQVVVEHHHKDPYREDYGILRRHRVRRFGETALSYYSGQENIPDNSTPPAQGLNAPDSQ